MIGVLSPETTVVFDADWLSSKVKDVDWLNAEILFPDWLGEIDSDWPDDGKAGADWFAVQLAASVFAATLTDVKSPTAAAATFLQSSMVMNVPEIFQLVFHW
jgi:hypothetical protein